MKRIALALLAMLLALSFVACGTVTTTDDEAASTPSAGEGTPSAGGDEMKVMTYEEYLAAALQTKVCVETYVQAKQGWWEEEGQGKASIYTQNEEGAYFIYNMPCTEEQYGTLTVGTKIRVTGYKIEFSGEVEIGDVESFQVLEGNYVATAKDVTALLGTDDLIKEMNKFVSFKGMTVAASTDADGNEVAFLYKWNGSGAEGDDLYFKVALGENVYTFTVESYLCGADSDVYKTVKELKVGDKIDM
ncbi:MAG: hypothetical protein IJY89_06180, partial [Clostridia bacterium]|nr:hypothetical protein [Clostridia bacterium]